MCALDVRQTAQNASKSHSLGHREEIRGFTAVPLLLRPIPHRFPRKVEGPENSSGGAKLPTHSGRAIPVFLML